jgi:signal transduction histidine kinase
LVTQTDRGSKGMTADTLDLLGVLRASQALSSETSVEGLIARVGETMVALTGATRVRVLTRDETQWWLLVPAAGQPPMAVAEAGAKCLLPASMIAYAQRTREPLVVDDACRDDRFARDPYFSGRGCCSALVIPIATQGRTRAMVLLENDSSPAAFSTQRQDAVRLIAGQLAVSLGNAQLYESLESRVDERTRELQEAQGQLVATARRAGMAEIANNVLHSVGNVLNSVNVSTRLVRRTLGESRTQALRAPCALLDEHAGRLDEFTKSDPRGRILIPYLNRIAELCEAERQGVVEELDRLVRSIDYLKEIVATQQTHAGASSVLQAAGVHEILEEAIRVSSGLMNSLGVVVVREFGNIAPLLLDKSRLLQILLNLMSNASHAMESIPADARKLTLATALVRDSRGERLRITVRDEGEGIAPSHLASIFAHGFTTKKSGHGFGLHASAVAAIEMGGTLVAHSDGAGRGALFTLEVPAGKAEPQP